MTLHDKAAFLRAAEIQALEPENLSDQDIEILGELNPRLRLDAERARTHAQHAIALREQQLRHQQAQLAAKHAPASGSGMTMSTLNILTATVGGVMADLLRPIHARLKALEAAQAPAPRAQASPTIDDALTTLGAQIRRVWQARRDQALADMAAAGGTHDEIAAAMTIFQNDFDQALPGVLTTLRTQLEQFAAESREPGHKALDDGAMHHTTAIM